MDAIATARPSRATFRMPPGMDLVDPSVIHRLRFVGQAAASPDRQVVVDLSRVRLLPSGFVQTLLDWHAAGAEVLLVRPRPHVRAMVWFRLFARGAGPQTWRVTDEPAFQFCGGSPDAGGCGASDPPRARRSDMAGPRCRSVPAGKALARRPR